MSWVAKDLPTLIFQLLPGFLSAGIFYTLTAHPKASEFERVVQALIFTVLIKPVVALTHVLFVWIGPRRGSGRLVLGRWTEMSDLSWSLACAVLIGFIFAYLTNTDKFHTLIRYLGWTSRTSYPSEWYSAFVRCRTWVVLHLSDQRRLYGWPREWPDQSDKGHFVLEQPEWLPDNTSDRVPIPRVRMILIPAGDVRMVEFLNEDDGPTHTAPAPTGEPNHGSQSPPTGPEPTGS